MLLMCGIVSAGESYDLGSFSDEPTQGIVVGQDDEVRFEMFNATHTIVFDKVNDVGFRFYAFPYMKSNNKMMGFATSRLKSYLDLNKDNVTDLVVGYYSSEFNEEANQTYVTVLFKADDGSMITGNVVDTQTGTGISTENPFRKYFGVIGAVAFILILILIARKSDKVKKGEEDSSLDIKEEK